MWEKDKKLLAAYRQCMQDFVETLKSGEEADYESACVVESEKLQSYSLAQTDYYMGRNPSELSDKRQMFFNPRMPFFQDF